MMGRWPRLARWIDRADNVLGDCGCLRPFLGSTNRSSPLENLEAKLQQEGREKVEFSFSLRTARRVEDGIQVHMVLKFHYPDRIIESIMCAKRPEEDEIHERDTSRRIFPYCIFNSVDEQPHNWTFHRGSDNKIEEKIEVLAVLTCISHRQYFPFVLELLPIKIGSDGTGKTKLINLIPKMKRTNRDHLIPDAGFGVFTKSTSPFSIGRNDDETIARHVVCRSCVRDLEEETLRDQEGIITRVYVAIFFEHSCGGDIVLYIVIPTLTLQLLTFFPKMGIGDIVQNLLALVIANVAMLFVLSSGPAAPGRTMCMAEQLIVMQICYSLLVGFGVGFFVDHVLVDKMSNHEVVMFLNLLVTVATAAWTFLGWRRYHQLKKNIRKRMEPVLKERNMALFAEVEKEI